MKDNKEKKISKITRDGTIETASVTKPKYDRRDFSYISYLNLGFYLVTPLLLGVFLGTVMDNWLHTKPFFIILFIVLGTIASFYNLIKITRDVTR